MFQPTASLCIMETQECCILYKTQDFMIAFVLIQRLCDEGLKDFKTVFFYNEDFFVSLAQKGE